MGLFDAVGSVFGAFGKNKTKQLFHSNEVKQQADDLTASLPGIRARNQQDLDRFDAETDRAIGTLRGFERGDIDTLSGLIDRSRDYDPIAGLERIREGNIGALNTFLSGLSGQGSRADKVAQANLGLGGRPRNSFSDQLRTSFLSTQASPILNTIFANLGNQTGVTANDRLANNSQLLNLIDARSNVPLRIPQAALSPITARTNTFNTEIGALSGLSNVAKNNSAGFQSNPDFMSRLGSAFSGVGSAFSDLGSIGGIPLASPSPAQNNQATGLLDFIRMLRGGSPSSINTNPFLFGLPQVA